MLAGARLLCDVRLMPKTNQPKAAFGSKREFILKHIDLPTQQIIREAAKQKLKLGAQYIYVVRSSLKPAKPPKKLKKAPPSSAKALAILNGGEVTSPAPRHVAARRAAAQPVTNGNGHAPVQGPASSQRSSLEASFFDAAISLGTVRAEELLKELKGRVHVW